MIVRVPVGTLYLEQQYSLDKVDKNMKTGILKLCFWFQIISTEKYVVFVFTSTNYLDFPRVVMRGLLGRILGFRRRGKDSGDFQPSMEWVTVRQWCSLRFSLSIDASRFQGKGLLIPRGLLNLEIQKKVPPLLQRWLLGSLVRSGCRLRDKLGTLHLPHC